MSKKSIFDVHPHLLKLLKEEMRKDINIPTDKLFWMPEFQKFKVTKQAISAKKRAYINNPALLDSSDLIPAQEKAQNRKLLTLFSHQIC